MAQSRIAPRREGEIYEVIRRAGGRLTVPTRTVVAILLDSDRHLTADALIAEVERRTPGIAPSTIYRVLLRLDELDVIEHVHSGSGPTFYHLRERGHAHLVCNGCGAIIDIPDDVFTQLGRTVQSVYGFSLEPRHAALLGRCSECS
jgi:Fur family ferric uptake transcriptional regulator